MKRSPIVTLLALLAAWLLAPAAPAKAPAPQDPAAAPASPAQPFLWRIERGEAKGYLYGTIHLPDARALTIPEQVKTALDASTALYAEIETTPEVEQQVQMAALLPPAGRLDRMVGPETWARVEARIRKAGLPAAYSAGLARMKPWAVGATLPMLKYLPEMSAGRPPLDKWLFQQARDAGKKVGGLEEPAEQIAAFEVFTDAEHLSMLTDTLDELDRYEANGRDLIEETLAAWLSGDEGRLLALMDAGFGTDPALKERAAAAFLWRRNLRMAGRIDERMSAEGTTFFAVGALHMPDAPSIPATSAGEDEAAAPQRMQPKFEVEEGKRAPKLGLVSLLRAQGYTVEPIR